MKGLEESWVLSAPKERYRCLDCALHYNIILEIPSEIKPYIEEEAPVVV